MTPGAFRFLVLAAGLGLSSAPAVAADPKPNIVYIVADDLGWKDVGFHGSDIATPNPEKVAELQKRANELAATMAKPLLLEAEFRAIRQRLALPPALPTEEFELDEAP